MVKTGARKVLPLHGYTAFVNELPCSHLSCSRFFIYVEDECIALRHAFAHERGYKDFYRVFRLTCCHHDSGQSIKSLYFHKFVQRPGVKYL